MNIVSSLCSKARKDFGLVLMATSLSFFSYSANALTVTVSVTPLAGIIAPLLGEKDSLKVVLKPGQSPHGFQMTPADMKRLASSDLLVWVDTPVDMWMKKAKDSVGVNALAMHDLKGLVEYPVRQGGVWEKHDHNTHEAEEDHTTEHEGHGHDDHDEHNHEHEHEHETDESHALKIDGHLWMSVENAILLVKKVSQALQELSPNEATQIAVREKQWLSKLQQTDLKVKEQLQTVSQVPYMVLHDAFQYFEKRYQLNGVGSIQLNPAVSPSLKRVKVLRDKIAAGDVQCVFKEPQFPQSKVLTVTKGLNVKIGSLDPLGFVKRNQSTDQADYLLYDAFLLQLAGQFRDCLIK